MEHVNGSLNERHVVHNRRGDSQQAADHGSTAVAQLHQHLRVVVKHPCSVQRTHSEQHSSEEEQACEVHGMESFHDTTRLIMDGVGSAWRRGSSLHVDGLLLLGKLGQSLEGSCVGDEPENAESEEHAEVGRQARDHLQHRDHQNAHDAHDQHQDIGATNFWQNCFMCFVLLALSPSDGRASLALAAHLAPRAKHGAEASHEGGQEEPADGVDDRDLVGEPQHGGRDIADRTPSTSSICCDDNQTTNGVSQMPVMTDAMAQEFQGHNGRRQVVNDRAEEEAEGAKKWHQQVRATTGPQGDVACNDTKASEVIDGLYNAHSRQ
mmetsp:Transcript_56918/g.120967  ORF Transcript_56918/g.120967 Transcript_56918/m.120967 type:complete len:322 (-) Transcript_56918:588-1553(-)